MPKINIPVLTPSGFVPVPVTEETYAAMCASEDYKQTVLNKLTKEANRKIAEVCVYPKFRTLEVLEKLAKEALASGWTITRFSGANMYFVATKYAEV